MKTIAFFHFSSRGLDVNEILDLLGEKEIVSADQVFIEPPEGEDSDGYDLSDTEEGHPDKISRSILQVQGFL